MQEAAQGRAADKSKTQSDNSFSPLTACCTTTGKIQQNSTLRGEICDKIHFSSQGNCQLKQKSSYLQQKDWWPEQQMGKVAENLGMD